MAGDLGTLLGHDDGGATSDRPVTAEEFGAMINRHRTFIRRVIVRIVHDPDLADDLTQDTFVRALRARAEFRSESELTTWLYRVATNVAFNAVTRRHEWPSATLPEGRAGHEPVDEVLADDWSHHVRLEIAKLPTPLREAFILREYEDLSYQEVARRLGVPINTARTRILRGRRALVAALRRWAL